MQLGLLGCRQTRVLVSQLCVKLWFFPLGVAWVCGEGRDSGIWHEFVQQQHSWVLKFILAVLCHLGTAAFFLLCGRLPSLLLEAAVPSSLHFPSLPEWAEGPFLTLQSAAKTVCPTISCSVLLCQRGLITGPSSLNSCKKAVPSGMFTGFVIQQVMAVTLDWLVCSKPIPALS